MNEKLSEISGIHPQRRDDYVDECAQYVYPVLFDSDQFGGISYREMYKELEDAGIPTDDVYPPLHGLGLFKDMNLPKGIDFGNANWGGEKSADGAFPVAEKVHEYAFELEQTVLLSGQEALDYVVESIKNIQTKYSA